MINEYAHLSWVLDLPYDPANFTYTETEGGLPGVLSVGQESLRTPSMRPAAAQYSFVGSGDAADANDSDASSAACGGGPKPEIVLGSGVPRALLRNFAIPPGETTTICIALTIGHNKTEAQAMAMATAATPAVFGQSWDAAHEKWEARVRCTASCCTLEHGMLYPQP